MNANKIKTHDMQCKYILEMLMTVFPDNRLSTDAGKYYIKYLKDIPIKYLRKGVDRIIRNRKHQSFPTIGEIREACDDSGYAIYKALRKE